MARLASLKGKRVSQTEGREESPDDGHCAVPVRDSGNPDDTGIVGYYRILSGVPDSMAPEDTGFLAFCSVVRTSFRVSTRRIVLVELPKKFKYKGPVWRSLRISHPDPTPGP